jgi:hypothetical protein
MNNFGLLVTIRSDSAKDVMNQRSRTVVFNRGYTKTP